jgi:hypothetical protein
MHSRRRSTCAEYYITAKEDMQRGRSSCLSTADEFLQPFAEWTSRAQYLLFYGLFVLQEDAQGQEINNTCKNATTTAPT